MNGRRSRWTEPAILAIAILVAAALGPFGTYAFPWIRRLGHWAVFLLAGYAFFKPVVAGANALAAQSGLPRWVALAGASLLAALPSTLVVAFALAGFRWRLVTLGDLAGLYPQVLVVGAAMVLLLGRGASRPAVAEPLASEAVPPAAGPLAFQDGSVPPMPAPVLAAATFLDLLPPHLGRDLICLENEDHYVRAHTAAGSALILMRMRDAVAQLDSVQGARVHRGWWVARGAVAGVIRQDRNLRLTLIDGREVLVARANVAALRAEGWLEGHQSAAQRPER